MYDRPHSEPDPPMRCTRIYPIGIEEVLALLPDGAVLCWHHSYTELTIDGAGWYANWSCLDEMLYIQHYPRQTKEQP